jgi:GT2 family glycosyltransferase
MEDYFDDMVALAQHHPDPEIGQKIMDILDYRRRLDNVFFAALNDIVGCGEPTESVDARRQHLNGLFVMMRDDLEDLRLKLFQNKEG